MKMKRKNKKWFLAVLTAALAGATAVGCTGKNDGEGNPDLRQETEIQGSAMEGKGAQADLRDGTYEIRVDSSSSMFRITHCELTVKDGSMEAVMTMGGTGYRYLYMGTGEEAKKASEEAYIPYEETAEGAHTFRIPVRALDEEIPCSAFSKKKETWYDRSLVFCSDSLPMAAWREGALSTPKQLGLQDGTYEAEVTLSGGSGKAILMTPCQIQVKQGEATALLVWDSPNYDYMKVGEERFEPLKEGEEPGVDTEGKSVFRIPVPFFGREMKVIADTIAMSEPHEIEYTLLFQEPSIPMASFAELLYADQFSIGRWEEEYPLITIKEGGQFLVVPEGKEKPEGISDEITVLFQPLDEIYLAATSAMDLFRALDSVDSITLSGTESSGWHIKEAKEAMEDGKMIYAGKYNSPDYERILSEGCDLAVESTMIYHAPKVKEQLERLGIPVLVERSSYESHPLGRMEWIKLYGVLMGKEEQANAVFEEQLRQLEPILDKASAGRTAAFFYIHSNGMVNVRKPGDYVSKMIKLAGGEYVPNTGSGEENALSTMNMQMEAFYAGAKDADHLIYNSAVDGGVEDLEELLEKSSFLKDFKAVKEGNVWCTEKSMFQETMGIGNMMMDLYRIFTEEDPKGLTCLYRLK